MAVEVPPGAGAGGATARHLRGSSLLLAGRLVALAVDFAAHVIAVRYLTKGDFGAYAYALAIATLLSSTLVLGLPETISRYAPMFLERRQVGKLIGAFVVATIVVVGGGGACVLAVNAFEPQVAGLMGSGLAAKLLAILVLVVPSDGLNLVFQGLFAALGRVRSIFVRQYVLVPGLRLGVALILVLGDRSVTFLAAGYVAASAMGLLWYASIAAPAIRAQARNRFPGFELPFREIMSFALPVFLTNAFWVVLVAVGTIALGVMADDREVADFQAVLPPARLNQLALAIFVILFIPTVSRHFVRNELDAIRHAYATTTAWLIVITVPVLALTSVFAAEFVPFFFGEEYRGSVAVLALLAVGYYLHTSAGFNSATLKVFRRLRYTVVIDLCGLAAGIAYTLILVPAAGAVGAAVAFLAAIVTRNLPYLWALRRVTGIRLLTPAYLRLQASVAAVLGVLLAVQLAFAPALPFAVGLACLGGAVVLSANRDALRLEEAFPELGGGRLGALARFNPARGTRRGRE